MPGLGIRLTFAYGADDSGAFGFFEQPFPDAPLLCNGTAGAGQNICDQGVTLIVPPNQAFASVNQTVVIGETPEPSTWAMMLLGFAGLGFAGYRASRKAAAA